MDRADDRTAVESGRGHPPVVWICPGSASLRVARVGSGLGHSCR